MDFQLNFLGAKNNFANITFYPSDVTECAILERTINTHILGTSYLAP